MTQQSLFPEESLLARVGQHRSAYGVTLQDLHKIGHADGGFNTLRRLFYGINMVPIPAEVLAVLNPVEILAAYVGVFSDRYEPMIARRDGIAIIRQRPDTTLDTVIDDFCHSIGTGFKKPGIGGKTNMTHPNNVYPVAKGSLVRLCELPDDAKEGLLAAMTPPAEMEMPYDRNIDGSSKRVYIDDIMRALDAKYFVNNRPQ